MATLAPARRMKAIALVSRSVNANHAEAAEVVRSEAMEAFERIAEGRPISDVTVTVRDTGRVQINGDWIDLDMGDYIAVEYGATVA